MIAGSKRTRPTGELGQDAQHPDALPPVGARRGSGGDALDEVRTLEGERLGLSGSEGVEDEALEALAGVDRTTGPPAEPRSSRTASASNPASRSILTSRFTARIVPITPFVYARRMPSIVVAGPASGSIRRATRITLRDIHEALGERLLLGIDVAGSRGTKCRIQRAVAGTLDDFLDEAEALLAARLGRITLASLAAPARG